MSGFWSRLWWRTETGVHGQRSLAVDYSMAPAAWFFCCTVVMQDDVPQIIDRCEFRSASPPRFGLAITISDSDAEIAVPEIAEELQEQTTPIIAEELQAMDIAEELHELQIIACSEELDALNALCDDL